MFSFVTSVEGLKATVNVLRAQLEKNKLVEHFFTRPPCTPPPPRNKQNQVSIRTRGIPRGSLDLKLPPPSPWPHPSSPLPEGNRSSFVGSDQRCALRTPAARQDPLGTRLLQCLCHCPCPGLQLHRSLLHFTMRWAGMSILMGFGRSEG